MLPLPAGGADEKEAIVMRIQDIYDGIFQAVCSMPVIDTHEHLPWDEAQHWSGEGDVLTEYLSHYLSSDLISAGLSQQAFQKVVDPSGDLMERWLLAEPYWEVCRYTGYGRSLDLAVKGIYGIDGIRRDTIEELNRRFLQHKKPGHMHWVLQELCGIEQSLLDVERKLPGESSALRRIWRPTKYIRPPFREECDLPIRIQEKYGIRLAGLEDWLQAMELELDEIRAAHGVNLLKIGMAYERPLRFEKVSLPVARTEFSRAMERYRRGEELWFTRELQDFVMHALLGLANERGMTLQFHTGLLEGNGNVLANSSPALLNNLFLDYPDVRFDLFHIGYPYQGEACALAKMFPNVTVDMCWAHIISPSACVAALHDFLDAIPYNKISAFGGDYLFPDGVYGHLLLSRQNVSRVLAEKAAAGVFSTDRALDIARAMYYENPKRIFQL